MPHALLQQPRARGLPGLGLEPPAERAHAHPRVRGQRGEVELLVEPLQRPRPGRRRTVAALVRHDAFDELRLAAVAPRRYDAVPRGPVGDLAAVVAADQCRHRSTPAASPAEVRMSPSSTNSSVLVELHLRVERAEQLGAAPSAWWPAARRAARRRRARTRRCRSTRSGCRAGSWRAPRRGRRAACPRSAAAAIVVPGMITVSASASASGPWSGIRLNPALARTGATPARRRGRRTAGCRRRRVAAPNTVGGMVRSKPTTGSRARTATRCGPTRARCRAEAMAIS